jgi:hypothetical protein
MTKTTWLNTPGSTQHWLYGGSSIEASRVIGMIYKVTPTRFAVYKENQPNPSKWGNREFMAHMPTLDEAKALLMTITQSRAEKF